MQHGTNLLKELKQSDKNLKHSPDMKTTENISLAGMAFTIEIDAYEALKTYLSDIQSAFSTDSSAEEIVNDIEERIAELLRERCAYGIVVNLSMIQEIKERIGDPRTLAEEDAEASSESAANTRNTAEDNQTQRKEQSWKTKRAYRNIDEKVLGGVCAGIASYFGIDKVLVRIIFLALFFTSFFGIEAGPYPLLPGLAYICLWIAMPAARTDEQKREMKGRPINLESYRSTDFNFSQEVKDAAASPAGQCVKRAGGIFLGILLLIAGLGGMISEIFIPSVSTIVSHEIAEEVYDLSEDLYYIPEIHDVNQFVINLFNGFNTTWILIMVIIGILMIWFIYNGIMLIFDMKYPSWRPGLIIFIAWIISIFVFGAYIAKMAIDASLPTCIMF